MLRCYFCAFLILSLLYIDEEIWIPNWKADSNIVTNLSCIADDNKCFSTNQELIINENKESHFYRKDPCIFPYKYSNTVYHSCTMVDWDGFWCATSVDAELDMQTWGNCNDLCPLEGTVQFS